MKAGPIGAKALGKLIFFFSSTGSSSGASTPSSGADVLRRVRARLILGLLILVSPFASVVCKRLPAKDLDRLNTDLRFVEEDSESDSGLGLAVSFRSLSACGGLGVEPTEVRVGL